MGPVGGPGPRGADGIRGAPGQRGDDGANGTNGATGATGPSIPRVYLASAVGMAPANSAAANRTAYESWAQNTDAAHTNSTLQFDVPGVYLIDTGADFEALDLPPLVPANRKLDAVPGVTLRATTASVEYFFGAYPGVQIRNLTLDANSLCQYAIKINNPTVVYACVVSGATVAQIYAVGAYAEVERCTCNGGPKGILFVGSSESKIYDVLIQNWTDTAIHVRGNLVDSGVANGGRFSARNIICGASTAPNYGIDIDGVGQANIMGITVEGAATAPIRIRNKSTNIRIHGSRSNAGAYAVIFDQARGCSVEGGCVSTAKIQHVNDSRGCFAFVEAESAVAPVQIVQEYGTAPWSAYLLARKRWHSIGNNAPTDGFWEVRDEVSRDLASGQPIGWRCTVAGNPGTWVALPSLP